MGNKEQALKLMERILGSFPPSVMRDLTWKLDSKLESEGSPFLSLFLALRRYYVLRCQQSTIYSTFVQEVGYRATKINEHFSVKLRTLLENNFFRQCLTMEHQHSPFKPTIDLTCRSQAVKDQFANKSKTSFNLGSIKGAAKINQTVGSFRAHSDSSNFAMECTNLISSKPTCLCQSSRPLEEGQNTKFECIHCRRQFHRVCMRKKVGENYCPYCQLERMVPLKKVVNTAWLGVLRRGVKKHSITFDLPQLAVNHKVQVRCLRLKQGAQTSCLFPDKADFVINRIPSARFDPINKQSCLKYRKDEPFIIHRNEYISGMANTISVSEVMTYSNNKKEFDDLRYESQNHLLGVFVVQELQVDNYIQQALTDSTLGYSESRRILQNSFRLGQGDDDISCQLVKIPLICPLTTVRIDIPVRGTNCAHFQCFDLKNYLVLISQSQNPRWKCPVCGAVAFSVEVDSILLAILKRTSNQKVKELLFFKDCKYAEMVDEEPLPERFDVKDLNIPERTKQPLPLQSQPQPEPAPLKPVFVIPENAEVIEID